MTPVGPAEPLSRLAPHPPSHISRCERLIQCLHMSIRMYPKITKQIRSHTRREAFEATPFFRCIVSGEAASTHKKVGLNCSRRPASRLKLRLSLCVCRSIATRLARRSEPGSPTRPNRCQLARRSDLGSPTRPHRCEFSSPVRRSPREPRAPLHGSRQELGEASAEEAQATGHITCRGRRKIVKKL